MEDNFAFGVVLARGLRWRKAKEEERKRRKVMKRKKKGGVFLLIPTKQKHEKCWEEYWDLKNEVLYKNKSTRSINNPKNKCFGRNFV